MLLLAISLNRPALGADISLTAAVDKNEASIDDTIELRVTVEGTRDEPERPDLSAFKIQSRGSSTQMTIINGSVSSKLEYSYLLYPQKSGTFTIGSFTLRGGAIRSDPITVVISRSEPQQRETGDVFVTASVDNEKPFLNEQITYTFQFCRRVQVASANLTEQPTFDGFLVENLGKEREFQKIINGQQYLVTEIKQALFPLKTGEIEITPTTLQAAVASQGRSRRGRGMDPFFDDSFFGFAQTTPKTFRTDPVRVLVAPLPEEGRPANFKNLVGQFSIESQLSATAARVGDSLTLTVTIYGTGSLKNLQNLEIGPIPNFKIYDDKPLFEPFVSGGKIGGKITIKKALVPLAAGELTVPPAEITYFDQSAKKYTTAKTNGYVVQVAPAASSEKIDMTLSSGQHGPGKQEIELLGKDILPIHTSTSALSCQRSNPMPGFIFVCLLIPPALFFVLLRWSRARARVSGDQGVQRQKTAMKNFSKNMADAERAIGDESAFYHSVAKALRDFIGDKLNITGQALTGKDLDALFGGKVPPELLGELRDIFEIFDSGQFGFQKISPGERKSVLHRMRTLVQQLNKVVRK